MALLPKQTKNSIKIYKNITLERFICLIFAIFAGLIFGNLVHVSLKILFMILVPVAFFLLTLRSPINPKKNFFFSLIDFFKFTFKRKKYSSLLGYAYKEWSEEDSKIEKKRKHRKSKTKEKIIN